ncbi:hypothetical protein AVEN_181855-1 [Araneus ventricosus]|uniref:Tc1-like transposase DDE domain-containing protein n=1 Tax=Araneus ventricosus TaxID=182803 RepID=A0A4Y2TVQ2_ARAVE|nr:hypothetical protein AVEN_181855-1 [Araneus ventricosus]
MCQTPEDTNSATAGAAALCPVRLCRADCVKEVCSHDDLLFVCLCPQRTSERSCIGPVNIAVGHQSSGTTYSLRMSLDFNIQNDSRMAMIWREPGSCYRAPHIVEKDHYRGGELLVWAGIATNGRTDLYVSPGGSVTAVRYRNEFLHPLIRPFIAGIGIDAIFMDDNARPHGARLVRSYLKSETIPQMAWPARSPDLNPIEHVWDMLVRRIAGRSVPPGTLHDLQQTLLQEWTLLPQQAINDIIASLPRSCQACISTRGYHTRY